MLITGAQCDKCGARELLPNHLKRGTIVGRLRSMGWSVGKCEHDMNARTVCPACRKVKKGEEA